MFYRGKVENNIDPQKNGKVQVRIFGIHDNSIPVDTLPWAEVSGGTDFGLVQGVGVSSILRNGTFVWLFLLNEDPDHPVIFGVVKGAGDISQISKGSYTNIASIVTDSGHIIELNDSGGSEKIEIKHKSGSKIVIQPDGSILIQSVNNMVHNVSGNYDITAGGNFKVQASRIDLN